MHNMTINKNDKGLTYKQCVDFCDYAEEILPKTFFYNKENNKRNFEPQEFKKNLIGLKILENTYLKKFQQNYNIKMINTKPTFETKVYQHVNKINYLTDHAFEIELMISHLIYIWSACYFIYA